MKERPIRFIVAAYGGRYRGLLLCCLYSIWESNPNAAITVLWSRMPQGHIRLLQDTFASFEFIEVAPPEDGQTSVARIAHKTRLWKLAAHLHPDELVVFVDVDTLVLKDVEHFFNEEQFDIGFTYKEDLYPLNTGVLLMRGKTGAAFFDEWMALTERILQDPEALYQSTSRDYLYGGPDQMALYQFIAYDPHQSNFVATTETGIEIRFHAFPCAVLNFVHSSPITSDMHILHYKAGLQKILIDGTGFTHRRTREESWDMYLYYLQLYKRALAYVEERTGVRMPLRKSGIAVPFYFSKDIEPSPFLYRLFAIKERARMAIYGFLVRLWIRYLKPLIRGGA